MKVNNKNDKENKKLSKGLKILGIVLIIFSLLFLMATTGTVESGEDPNVIVVSLFVLNLLAAIMIFLSPKFKNFDDVETQVDENGHSHILCKYCGGKNVNVQLVSSSNSIGCFGILIYFLLFISILGWFVLIPMILRKKTIVKKYYVCQDCGKTWKNF